MQDYILEICADSAESAIAAEKGGATRLELCQNLIIGGTTPGPKLFEIVRHAVEIPVHVLIRPRFGDFCYSDYEMEQIKEEIKMFRELGADGVVIGVLLLVLFCIMFAGLKVVNPNEALVLTLFGKYHGTIKNAGFFFVNPFCAAFNPTAGALQEETSQDLGEALKKGKTVKASSKTRGRKVSTKTMTLNNAQQKVNDVDGNPVIIGSVVIWKVSDPTKAVFNVENYFEYLSTQCDSIIRNSARMYPYDTMRDDDSEMTLRGSSLEIAEKMKSELQEKTFDAHRDS